MKMQFRLQAVVLLLSLLTAFVSSRALSPLEYNSGLYTRDDSDYDPSEDLPACVQRCGQPDTNSPSRRDLCYGSEGICSRGLSLQERTFEDVVAGNGAVQQSSLERRTFTTVTAGNVDSFVVRILGQSSTIPVVFQDSNGDDASTCVFSEIGGTQKVNMGTPGLHGCTVIAVISRRGVWMSHHWQTLAFSPPVPKPDGYPAVNFNQEVRNLITGQGTIRAQGPTLASVAQYFTEADDNPRAFIMTPRRWNANSAGNPQYPKKVPIMQSAISQVIPGISNVDVYDYVPLNDGNPAEAAELGSNARGSALFQYDPSWDGQGHKGTRLFFERTIRDGSEESW